MLTHLERHDGLVCGLPAAAAAVHDVPYLPAVAWLEHHGGKRQAAAAGHY